MKLFFDSLREKIQSIPFLTYISGLNLKRCGKAQKSFFPVANRRFVPEKAMICFVALLLTIVVRAQNKEITILAVNDMHASIDRFPKFAALVDSMRAIYPDLLLFSAGDNRTGNPVNDMHAEPSYPMIALMNKVGFNLSVLGNHEFDGDIGGLRNVLNSSVFRHVCANLHAPDSLRLHVEPYKFFEEGSVRIAVLGLIHQGMSGFPDAHPDKQGKMKTLQVKMTDGTRLNLQRTYKVLMNSYLAAICQYEKSDEGHSFFRATADYTIDYLAKQPAVDYQGIKRVVIKK